MHRSNSTGHIQLTDFTGHNHVTTHHPNSIRIHVQLIDFIALHRSPFSIFSLFSIIDAIIDPAMEP
jgi:hypothetical protein